MGTVQVDAGAALRPECRHESDPRRFRQGRVVTSAARRETAEPIRTQTFAGEVRYEPAQACSGEAFVVVGWVAHEGEVPALAIVHELSLRDFQEGPCQSDGRCQGSLGAHTREACRPAPRQKTHQNGLGLIVPGVPGEHEAGTDGFGMGGKESVTRDAGGLLKPPRRLWSGPGQGSVGETDSFGEAGDRRGFHARFRPKVVIDRGDVDGRRRIDGCRCSHQRGRVGSAGDREEDRSASQIGAERVLDRVDRFAQAAQRARFCSRVTPWRTLVLAEGNLRSNSARVAQACSRAPSALSEAPSFSMASGACAERA